MSFLERYEGFCVDLIKALSKEAIPACLSQQLRDSAQLSPCQELSTSSTLFPRLFVREVYVTSEFRPLIDGFNP